MSVAEKDMSLAQETFGQAPEGNVEHRSGIESGYGDTALPALCRAVVNAVFGDDVDEVPVHQHSATHPNNRRPRDQR